MEGESELQGAKDPVGEVGQVLAGGPDSAFLREYVFAVSFFQALGWKENRQSGGFIHPANARIASPEVFSASRSTLNIGQEVQNRQFNGLESQSAGVFFGGVPYSTPRVASASEGIRGSTEGMRGRAAWLSWSGDLRNRLTIHQSKAIARSKAIRA